MSANRIEFDLHAVTVITIPYYSKKRNHASGRRLGHAGYFAGRPLYVVDFTAKCDTIQTIAVFFSILG